MKKMVGCFAIEDANGTELDRFEFFRNGNHGTITNKNHCLYDGYYLEAIEVWEEKKSDMKMCEMLGNKIVHVK